MAEQSVTLTPGESTVVSFEVVPHEAKTYQVSVNGLTGSFVVMAAPVAELEYVPVGYLAGYRGPIPFYIRKLGVRETIYYLGESRGTTRWKRYECDIKNVGSTPGQCQARCFIRFRSNNEWSDWADSIELHSRVGYEPEEYDLVEEKIIDMAMIEPGGTITFVAYARFGFQDLHLEIKFVGDAGESPTERDVWTGFAY